MAKYKLPALYSRMHWSDRRGVREQYIEEQGGLCMHCKESLANDPPASITDKSIDWRAFPPNFLKHPVHLQHDHDTDLTEGAVHAYCNAVLWQFFGR